MRRLFGFVLLLALVSFVAQVPLTARGGWLETIKEKAPALIEAGSGDESTSGLTSSEMVRGLKQALKVAAKNSTSFLGQAGGYLDHAEVRIPMPESLNKAESLARTLGQDELADEFVESMNRAAEKAAPETVSILTDAVKAMTFADAKGILNGPDNAATQYFERTSTDALKERIRPIVEKATDAVGVTSRYKSFVGGVSSLGSLAGIEMQDLDGYVTDKAVAGLFVIMAREEKEIRENPVARTTDLLKKVFGAVDK